MGGWPSGSQRHGEVRLVVSNNRGTNDAIPEEGGQIQGIDVEKIKPSPFQYRPSPYNTTDLEESIPHEGLLHPIEVRKIPDGLFEVVHGHRRLEAFKKLGKPKIPAIIRSNLSDKGARIRLHMENLVREDPDWKVTARSLNELRELFGGISLRELSKRTGIGRHKVQEIIKALGLSPEDYRGPYTGMRPPLPDSQQEPGEPVQRSYLYRVRMPSELNEVLMAMSSKKAETTIVNATRSYLEKEGSLSSKGEAQ